MCRSLKAALVSREMGLGQNLLHFAWRNTHGPPIFDVHQGYRVLTHSHSPCWVSRFVFFCFSFFSFSFFAVLVVSLVSHLGLRIKDPFGFNLTRPKKRTPESEVGPCSINPDEWFVFGLFLLCLVALCISLFAADAAMGSTGPSGRSSFRGGSIRRVLLGQLGMPPFFPQGVWALVFYVLLFVSLACSFLCF